MIRKARIYKPSKTATQSGLAGTKGWVLEYQRQKKPFLDPLTGWTGCDDGLAQLRLHFRTREDAIAYASREGLTYRVDIDESPYVPKRSYADNFIRRG